MVIYFQLVWFPVSSSRMHQSYVVCLEVEGRLSELFYDVLCTAAVHDDMFACEQFL